MVDIAVYILIALFIISVIYVSITLYYESKDTREEILFLDESLGKLVMLRPMTISSDYEKAIAIILDCQLSIASIDLKFTKRLLPWVYNKIQLDVSDLRHKLTVISGISVNAGVK